MVENQRALDLEKGEGTSKGPQTRSRSRAGSLDRIPKPEGIGKKRTKPQDTTQQKQHCIASSGIPKGIRKGSETGSLTTTGTEDQENKLNEREAAKISLYPNISAES